jgi:hypothetical protein
VYACENDQIQVISSSRIYLPPNLEECVLTVPGTNLIHAPGPEVGCKFSSDQSSQHNVIFAGSDEFRDSPGVDVVVGRSDRSENILVSFAQYVDGSGGSDVINVHHPNTTVQTHGGDVVVGRAGAVILPFSLAEISSIRESRETVVVTGGETVISVGFGLRMFTRDGLSVTPLTPPVGGEVTRLQLVRVVTGLVDLEAEVRVLRGLENVNFVLVKQLHAANALATITDGGNYVFHADHPDAECFWEGSENSTNLYLPAKSGRYTIGAANGILGLEMLSRDTVISIAVDFNLTVTVSTTSRDLVVRLPSTGRKLLKLRLSDNRYYNLELGSVRTDSEISFPMSFSGDTYRERGLVLERDFCSHPFKVRRGSTTLSNLDGLVNCLIFTGGEQPFFLRHGAELVLYTRERQLRLSDFFGSAKLELSVSYNGRVENPPAFARRASQAREIAYFSIVSRSTICYLNQPRNLNQIGVFDFHGQRLSEGRFDGDDLILTASPSSSTAVLKNWLSDANARNVILVFDNVTVFSCVQGCEPSTIVDELAKVGSRTERRRRRRKAVDSGSAKSQGLLQDASAWIYSTLGLESFRTGFLTVELGSGGGGGGGDGCQTPVEQDPRRDMSAPQFSGSSLDGNLLLARWILGMFRQNRRGRPVERSSSQVDELSERVEEALRKYSSV